MIGRHRMAQALGCALALAACGSSHSAAAPDAMSSMDAAPPDAPLRDAGPRDSAMLDAEFGDATTSDAAPSDGGVCSGLGAAACFRNPACSPWFDDVCCSTCTPGPCADCTNYTYLACRSFEGCREFCGASPSWACYPTAPDCTGARPVDADSCSLTGCVPAVAPVDATPIVDTCVPITGDSCTVACRRSPPNCPPGTVPEGDGFCYTDRCIPAFVCD